MAWVPALNTLCSWTGNSPRIAYILPGVQRLGRGKLDDDLASYPGDLRGSKILLVASCYRNRGFALARWVTGLDCKLFIFCLLSSTLLLKLDCVAGVFKNVRQGNETPREGVRKLRSKERGSGERFLFTQPPPPSRSPLPTSPQFFAQPRRAPLLGRFFDHACSFDLRMEEERKRLLRRLFKVRGGKTAGGDL